MTARLKVIGMWLVQFESWLDDDSLFLILLTRSPSWMRRSLKKMRTFSWHGSSGSWLTSWSFLPWLEAGIWSTLWYAGPGSSSRMAWITSAGGKEMRFDSSGRRTPPWWPWESDNPIQVFMFSVGERGDGSVECLGSDAVRNHRYIGELSPAYQHALAAGASLRSLPGESVQLHYRHHRPDSLLGKISEPQHPITQTLFWRLVTWFTFKDSWLGWIFGDSWTSPLSCSQSSYCPLISER